MEEKHILWLTLKCYALIELGLKDESKQALRDCQPIIQKDPTIAKFLSLVMIKLGMDSQNTKMLENVSKAHGEREDVGE